jgi:poly-gamma-glutamate synthesis protein (capsule biosynthesis protein)
MKSVKTIKIHSKKIIIVIIAVILIIAISAGCLWYANYIHKTVIATKKADNSSNNVTVPEIPKQPTIHMVAMGDMLAHDSVIANAKTDSGYDFTKFFTNIKPTYKNADVVFCNQEGLSAGEQFGISGYPSFNAPTQFSADLQSGAGCNVINLANNHMGDKGVNAINATIDNWANLKPLAISGANKGVDDQNKVSFAIVNGIKIGFVSFMDFNNNKSIPAYAVNNYHDSALVSRLVTDARANADVVIVSMHWGVEDSNTVSADQQNQVNLLSSLGVDLIIGTGPHVLQKQQTVTRPDGGKMVVWYSLGNMLSTQLNINQLIGGIAQFDIVKTADKKVLIENLSFTPTYMHYEWTAAEANAGNLLARKNAMIYLLDSAADPLSRSLFNTTVAEQKQYVIDTIGPEVTIK